MTITTISNSLLHKSASLTLKNAHELTSYKSNLFHKSNLNNLLVISMSRELIDCRRYLR